LCIVIADAVVVLLDVVLVVLGVLLLVNKSPRDDDDDDDDAVGNSYRQYGQVLCFDNHRTAQVSWNKC
jgi:hypothetical protein